MTNNKRAKSPLFSMYLDDDDSEEWENELVRLKPDTAWIKPSKKVAILTNVSMVAINEVSDIRGVLQAENWNSSISLCVLFKHNPSQKMKIIWRSDQDINLVNRGNVMITLNILTRSSGI